MAYNQENIGASTLLHSFDDLKNDMPATGIKVSPRGLTTVLIDGATAGTVEVSVTYDTAAAIDAATALYTVLQNVTISGGIGSKIDFPIGPTGIKLATTTANIAARILG